MIIIIVVHITIHNYVSCLCLYVSRSCKFKKFVGNDFDFDFIVIFLIIVVKVIVIRRLISSNNSFLFFRLV